MEAGLVYAPILYIMFLPGAIVTLLARIITRVFISSLLENRAIIRKFAILK